MSASPPSLFNLAAFQHHLSTENLGRCFIYREETDTTMRIAAAESADGGPHGTLVFAESQTAGRGRVQGRSWLSNKAQNLLFTLILRVPVEKARILPVACPAAIAWAIRQFGIDAWVKWPNDVWVGEKKVAGLLIDSIGSCQSVGIGVNVNESMLTNTSADLSQAQSLKDVTGMDLPRELLLARICNRFEYLLTLPFPLIVEEYRSLDGLVNQEIIVMPNGKEDAARQKGSAAGISENGFLLFKEEGASSAIELVAHEVTVRPEVIKRGQMLYPPPQELISGEWENQLKSRVTFIAHPDGSLGGVYRTAVGNVDQTHPLHGSWCPTFDGGALVSFTVAWTKIKAPGCRSTTAWTGTLRILDGEIRIATTWNLTTALPFKDEWKSVSTNKDVFIKLAVGSTSAF